MIDAEYEELDEAEGELDLAGNDSLPWLESEDDEANAGGLDAGQIMMFAAALVLLLAAAVAGVWYVSNRAAMQAAVPDGSVIAAPAGPIKQRPDDPGGKEFAGTGNVAPVVGEGGSRPAVVADKPVLAPATPAPAPAPSPAAAKPTPAAATGGVGVQLAAYGTRARAEQGWADLSKRSGALAGVQHRVEEGVVNGGKVYRLRAVAANRAEAERLCAAIKADGLDCQVK